MGELIKPRRDHIDNRDILQREGGCTASFHQNTIVYLFRKNKLFAAWYLDGELHELSVFDSPLQEGDRQVCLGDIYVGKVMNLVSNLDAAFVEVSKGVNCYLPLRDDERTELFRTNRKGNDGLKVGDEILVQVVKEALKTKQPMVSGRIKLPECYDSLDSLRERASHAICFERIYQETAGYLKLLDSCQIDDMDHFQILTDDRAFYRLLHDHLEQVRKSLVPHLKLYEDKQISLHALYSFDSQLEKLNATKVWLKCGGYLVIEPTEAMTVIDVNSGKCTKKRMTEELVQLINEEAAREVFRQLRLRNLSGMILIDFINFPKKAAEKEFLHKLRQLAAQDRIPTTVHDVTALGIVEITRKKITKSLKEQLG